MITSPSNAKIKQLIQLKNRSKARREADLFIVEGIRMFCEIPEDRIQEVYITEEFLNKISLTEDGIRQDKSDKDNNKDIATTLLLYEKAKMKFKNLRFEIVTSEVFDKITDTVTPQGILCTVKCYHYSVEEIVKKEKPFLLMLEDIQDPGNLGTMFRTAEGAGIDGIIMSKGTVDVYNPKVVRATMGSIFRMPFYYADNMPELIQKMVKDKFQIYAAALDGAVEYTEVDYKDKVGILVGNEGNGLTKDSISASTQPIFIPMAGQVESLNASISAAVLMYHAKADRK